MGTGVSHNISLMVTPTPGICSRKEVEGRLMSQLVAKPPPPFLNKAVGPQGEQDHYSECGLRSSRIPWPTFQECEFQALTRPSGNSCEKH